VVLQHGQHRRPGNCAGITAATAVGFKETRHLDDVRAGSVDVGCQEDRNGGDIARLAGATIGGSDMNNDDTTGE
jgi:hypothetical protein